MYCLRGASQTHPEGWSSLLHVWIHPLLGGGFHHTLAVTVARACVARRAVARFAEIGHVPDRHKGKEADREVEFDSGLSVFVLAVVDVVSCNDAILFGIHAVVQGILALRGADFDFVGPFDRRAELNVFLFANSVLAVELEHDVFVLEGDRAVERSLRSGRQIGLGHFVARCEVIAPRGTVLHVEDEEPSEVFPGEVAVHQDHAVVVLVEPFLVAGAALGVGCQDLGRINAFVARQGELVVGPEVQMELGQTPTTFVVEWQL